MSILVFGTTGQVSQELARRREGIIALGRDQPDLSDPAACAKLITETDCHAVINAAAYTAVDKAESDEAMAALVIAEAVLEKFGGDSVQETKRNFENYIKTLEIK